MRDEKHYYVYILTNPSGTLYTAITNNLRRRVDEQPPLHRLGDSRNPSQKQNLAVYTKELTHLEGPCAGIIC